MEHDVPLDSALQLIAANPGKTAVIPLVAIKVTVILSAGETPGMYRAVLSRDGQVMADDQMNPLQFAAVVKPLVDKNNRLLRLQGMLLAAQTEQFLKGLTA
jgi:hypothetical protein